MKSKSPRRKKKFIMKFSERATWTLENGIKIEPIPRNKGRIVIRFSFDNAYIGMAVKQDVKTQEWVDKVKREGKPIEGQYREGKMEGRLNALIAEGASNLWFKSIPQLKGHFEPNEKRFDGDYDFRLVNNGKQLLTINIKSSEKHYDLSHIELLLNVEQFKKHPQDVYIRVDVDIIKGVGSIIGYATKKEIQREISLVHVNRKYEGRDAYVSIPIDKLHTLEELCRLFGKKLKINIELRSRKDEYFALSC